jgi:hypothetical protein
MDISEAETRMWRQLKNHNTHWKMTLKYVLGLMQMANSWWGEIADHLDQLIVFSDQDDKFTDEKLLKVKELFWVISKIDEILSMISDTLDQWEWFRDSNKLTTAAGDEGLSGRGLIPQGSLSPIPREEELKALHIIRKDLEEPIHQINAVVNQLLGSYTRFEAIRDRARSLRDGVSRS